MVLRGIALLAPPAALLVAGVAGSAPPPLLLAVVVLLSVGFAAAPDSGFGLLALGSVVGWWALAADDGLHAAVLLAAVLLTAAHLAGLLSAYGPPGAAVDARLATLWVGRGATVLLAAPLVWMVARLVRDTAPDVALWQAGLLVSVLAVMLVALGLSADGRAAR